MPFEFIGRLLGLPAYRQKTTELVVSAQQTLYKAILVFLTFTAILWMSVFLYATFYYTYMPAIAHFRPVHLQFSSCGREKGLCTYPSANVTLTLKQRLLMVGQPYRIVLEMEMPESAANQEAGMFMVCADLKDANYESVGRSCRSAILHYKSFLHHAITTFVFAPFLLSGSAEEKQIVSVELFTRFQEDPFRPATEALVEVQSQHVEIYQTYLKIHATFTGLRYFMFHWPILAACLGVLTNYVFLSIIAFLSWYKFYKPSQVVIHSGYDANAARSLEDRRAAAKEAALKKEQEEMLREKENIDESKAKLKENTDKSKDDQQHESKESEDDSRIKLQDGKEVKEDLEMEAPVANASDSFEDMKNEESKGDETSELSQEIEAEKASRTSDEFEVISDFETLKEEEIKKEADAETQEQIVKEADVETEEQIMKEADVAADEEKENRTSELKVEAPRSSSPTKSPNVRRRNKKSKHSK